MCRTDKFKYVSRSYEKDEFYDMVTDPGEQENLIDDPAFAIKIAEHKQLMLEWFINTCDVVPHTLDARG
jgi:hypothetical protein